MLRRRLDWLPEQTVALLTVVSLVAGSAGVGLLAAVTGLEEVAVMDACEAAVLVGLLLDEPEGFAVSHDLVRQTLVEMLSNARRVRLHARIARALEDEDRHHVSRLERHVQLARHLVEPHP